MSESAIFFLHGYGANSGPMRDFVDNHLSSLLPTDCEKVFLDGFIELEPNSRAWFDLDWYYPGLDLNNLPPDIVTRVSEQFWDALDMGKKKIMEKSTRIGVPLDKVCLFGFSQGAMMALGLCSRMSLGGVISYAGVYLNVKEKDPLLTRKIMLVHGDQDDVVPFNFLGTVQSELRKRGVEPTIHADSGSGHSISDKALGPIAEFVASVVA